MASVAACIDHVHNERKRQISGQLQGQRLVTFERARSVMLDAWRIDILVDDSGEDVAVRFEDGSQHIHMVTSDWAPGQPVWHGVINDEMIAVQVRPVLNGFALAHRGVEAVAHVYTRREADLAEMMPEKRAADTSRALHCPMPGLVKAIHVSEGQEVKAGEALCIVEAMKMENVLRAERDVTIAKISAKEGDSLAVDAVIMEFALAG